DHDEGHANTDEEDGDSEAPELESLHEGIKSISRQITDLRTELKTDLATFKDDLRRELKADLNTFRDDMNQQLTANKLAVQEHGRKLEEAETRVAGLECWSAAAYGALKQSLKEQKKLAEKLDDLESRSRRNNLRMGFLRDPLGFGASDVPESGGSARELQRRGFTVEEPHERGGFNAEALLIQLESASPWQHVPRRSDSGAIQRVRDQLQEFQYKPS
ncbi:hypothetical protein WMY93_033003, partial [Mugilogobius chulae]